MAANAQQALSHARMAASAPQLGFALLIRWLLCTCTAWDRGPGLDTVRGIQLGCRIMWPCIAQTRGYAAAAQSASSYRGSQPDCHFGKHQLLATLPGTLARLITRPLLGCRGRLLVRPPKTLQIAFFCMHIQAFSELILTGKTQNGCHGALMPLTMQLRQQSVAGLPSNHGCLPPWRVLSTWQIMLRSTHGRADLSSELRRKVTVLTSL